MEQYTFYYQSNNKKPNQPNRKKRKKLSKRELARRRRKRRFYISLFLRLGIPAITIIVIIILSISLIVRSSKSGDDEVAQSPNISIEKTATEEPEEEVISTPVVSDAVYSANETPSTTGLPSDVVSGYGILIDLADNSILAQRNPRTRICPASMTKILTVLVAAEHITQEQMEDKVTITLEFTDYSYGNDLSAVGFAENEEVTVRDLFYGTILPSGGDAAIALATYVAGSEEAFVELMNEKLAALQLSDSTHFTNVAGMYDDNHYSTMYDMAMIMHAAIDNEICREVLKAHTYTTSSTEQHPDGITISNWFLRRIEDKDCGLTVECAKTGFVVQSRNCAASFADDASGHGYICVTADSSSAWRCIYDHVSIYSSFSGLTEKPDIPADDVLPDDDSSNPDKPDGTLAASSSSSSSTSATSSSSTKKISSDAAASTQASPAGAAAADNGASASSSSTSSSSSTAVIAEPQIITPVAPASPTPAAQTETASQAVDELLPDLQDAGSNTQNSSAGNAASDQSSDSNAEIILQ